MDEWAPSVLISFPSFPPPIKISRGATGSDQKGGYAGRDNSSRLEREHTTKSWVACDPGRTNE